MLLSQEPVHRHLPDLDALFKVDDEFQELLAFLQFGNQPVGPEELNRPIHAIDERKKRRMISNREAAKRSRWRKKRHLENLTDEVSRLSLENRELKNWLALLLNNCQVATIENHRLRSESVYLQTKLLNLYRVLSSMQSHDLMSSSNLVDPTKFKS